MSAPAAWLGIWCLAAGWLLLVDFFLPPDPRGWILAGSGFLLLIAAAYRVRWPRPSAWLGLLVLPAAAAAAWPFPYKAGPLLLLAGSGLALLVAGVRRSESPLVRWLSSISAAVLLTGLVWLAQSAAALAYWWVGARTHQATALTPWFAILARMLSWTVGSSGGSLFLPHIDGTIQATTTWERLGAFPALLLAAGAWVLLALSAHQGTRRLLVRLSSVAIVGAGYLSFRYLALTAILGISRNAALFWLPLPTALSFLPLCLLLGSIVPLPVSAHLGKTQRQGVAGRYRRGSTRRYLAVAPLALLSSLAVVGLFAFHDPGRLKAGRVLLDETNSNWEWTTQALDTEWYGQKSGYNYYSLGQWLSYYFEVDTNFQHRTPELLSGYDVLIIKTPTAPFAAAEIDAIEAWVRRGGGLFLIGDHTNVFGTSSYLNPLARRFGLRFRYDSTYDLATLRVTLFERPRLLAHPAVLEMPPFLFATSCTLEAPLQADNVMVGHGLRALPVDYSTRVFFPDKEKEQDYPFGLFLQSAAVQYGRGRVVAFTDSTVFSNFTMFLAGKPEYFLGVINWLNHATRWPWLGWAFLLTGVLAAGAAVFLARRLERAKVAIVAFAAALLAAAVGPWLSLQVAEADYRLPQPHTPYTQIAFEGEHSRLLLPTAPVSGSPQASYQTFYVWTQRLGHVPTFVPTLHQAIERGDVLVLVAPYRAFSSEEMASVERFVAQGGRLLVLGEPRDGGQADDPTAQILAAFGLGLEARRATTGDVTNTAGESLGQLQLSGVVQGGTPLLTLGGQAPIVVLQDHGEGLVAATSFAQLLADSEMGSTSVIPNPHQRLLFEIEFWLLRGLVAGEFPPLRIPAAPGG